MTHVLTPAAIAPEKLSVTHFPSPIRERHVLLRFRCPFLPRAIRIEAGDPEGELEEETAVCHPTTDLEPETRLGLRERCRGCTFFDLLAARPRPGTLLPYEEILEALPEQARYQEG